MMSPTIRLYMFRGCSAETFDIDGSCEVCIGKIAHASDCHCTEVWQFFGLNCPPPHHTSASHRAPSMSCVENPPYFFMFLGAWTKDSVNFIKQDGGHPCRVRYLAKQISGRDIDRFDGPWHERFRQF